MANRQRMSKDELKKLLIEHGILEGIRLGRYEAVVQSDTPARKIQSGRSLVISYYYGNQYICTKHELKTQRDGVIHQDVEDVFINGIRYERE